MTNISDIEYVHVLEAEISFNLIEMLNDPNLTTDQGTWPTIRHKKVPFKPYQSFRRRLTAELLTLSRVRHHKGEDIAPEKDIEKRVGKRKRTHQGSERRNIREKV